MHHKFNSINFASSMLFARLPLGHVYVPEDILGI